MTGCSTKETSRPNSTGSVADTGGSGAGRNGVGGSRGADSARAPSRADVSKPNGPARPRSPARKFLGSKGCSGWRTTTWSRARLPSVVRTVASTASRSSPSGTAGGLTVFVRSSAPS